MLRGNRSFNNSLAWMHSGLAPTQNGLMGFGWVASCVGGWGKFVSAPSGYPAPTNGLYPAIRGGAMSSYKKGTMTVSASAIGAMGLCRTASGQAVLNGSTIGGLVAGGVASGAITLDASADIFALLAGVADGAAVLSGSADISAIGHASAQGDAVMDGSVEAYALGFMVATTEQTAEMNEVSIANAVWAKILGASSAGDLLQGAGAAGDPWLSDLTGYDGTQAGAIISQINTLIDELHKLKGLDAASPLTVTPTSMVAGDVELTIGGDGTTVTTVERV